MFYKKSFYKLALCFITKALIQNACATNAYILREGQGEVDIKGSTLTQSWPEGFSFCKDQGSYDVKRINYENIAPIEDDILKTWVPSNFTDLKTYNKGEKLESFKFVVHGLELKHLVKGIDTASFDMFIKKKLNDKVPTGNNFIPYYPYFFQQKTIISASVISQNLSATFGKIGLILTVPEKNYLCGNTKDIHTPTDIDFYSPYGTYDGIIVDQSENNQEFNTQGEYEVHNQIFLNKLPSLSKMLPKQKVCVTGSTTTQTNTTENIDGLLSLMQANLKMTDQQFKSSPNYNLVKSFISAAAPIISNTPISGKTSCYNEVAINPYRDDHNTSVKISGIFIRESKNKLKKFKKNAPVVKILKVADAFDLPVVHIDDGNYYETAL